MPILLEEDMRRELPRLYRVRQSFPGGPAVDVGRLVAAQMERPEIRAKLRPGMRIAVAVGSRGIQNLPLIVRTVLDRMKQAGTHPFIVSAMGSHGSGTPQGQRAVLESYGITPEAMGVDIVTDVAVERLGRTQCGADVYFDKVALQADLVVPINRIKPHTDFVADIQSGLCKMLVIGLGNHKGCTAMHEIGFGRFGDALLEAAGLIMQRANVGFGVGIVENAYDQTCLVEVIAAEKLVERERELVKTARDNMPRLMIPEIDVLIVEEIGKNISGAGYDPNILGKSFILKEFVLPVPKIGRMVLLGLSEETHGNGVGIGNFDVITRRVFDALDLESVYANAIAVQYPEDAKIPLIASSEEEAVRVAIKVLHGADRDRLRIVRIKNTLELETIWVSQALLEQVRGDDRLTLLEQ